MLMEFLNRSFAGLEIKIWLAILAALSVAAGVVIAIADNRDKRMIETAQESGAAGAVAQGHQTTLGQLKDANNAEQGFRAGGERSADRFNQCLQDSDRASACERFRPVAE